MRKYESQLLKCGNQWGQGFRGPAVMGAPPNGFGFLLRSTMPTRGVS